MITSKDVRTVINIARDCLANPVKRAAQLKRAEAVGRMASACQRGEPTEVLDRLRAEFDAANEEYRQLTRRK